MGKAHPKFGKVHQRQEAAFGDSSRRVVGFLRAAHPAKTAEQVEAATRVPAETVRKWLAGAAAPSYGALLRLIAAYGPDLLCEALGAPPGWLSDAARAERQAILEADYRRILAARGDA